MKQLDLEHRQVIVNGVSIHAAEAGNREGRTILFLHGYPESWAAFEPVMTLLSGNFHLLAVDLPGTGKSEMTGAGDKRSIAALLDGFMQQLGLENVILAGHDIGGMIAYAFLRHFPAGFKDSGLQSIVGKVIPGSGHFSPEEQPDAVANAIIEFVAS